mgnify:CR=1 FL=1
MRILKIEDKKDKKVLRKKASVFDFDSMSKSELRELLGEMRKTMKDADGVGLAANQIGISSRFFVAEFDRKFYAIFNPEIVSFSKTEDVSEEGCLSVPGTPGEVSRYTEITIKWYDRNGKRVKMRAWGSLAQIFQHEVDHLNGKLFTDYIKR